MTARIGVAVARTGPLTVDLAASTATVHGAEIRLTAREWQILAYLAERVGQWCADPEIRSAVWGEYGFATAVSAISTHRARLRTKLGAAAYLIEVSLSGPRRRGSRMRLAAVEPDTMTGIQPLPASARELALTGYREIAEAERMMHAESRCPAALARAEYAEMRIDGLERDGVIDWSVAP